MDNEKTNTPEQTGTQQDKFFAMPQGFAEALMEYLGTKPYKEVAPFINGFGQLQPLTLQSQEPEVAPTEKPLASAARGKRGKKNETTEDK